MESSRKIACVLTFLVVLSLCLGKNFEPTWDSLDTHVAPSWYDEAKLGIFMTWGVYSVPSFGTEWFWERWKGSKLPEFIDFMKKNYAPNFQYQDFAPQFTAEFFDANQWADLVQASGAKYYIITSKHHDGFTLWRSNVSWNWNSVDAGPHRDIIGELANAFRSRTDVHYGIYFSLFEWFHPLYLYDKRNNYTTQRYVEEVMLPQMYDYVTRYKPEYIWSDGDWEASPEYWKSKEWLAWLYNDSPVHENILVNDRWGSGTACHHGDVRNCQDKFDPRTRPPFRWEDCTTLDATSWGFRREMDIKDVKTPEDVIKLLIRTVSLGGNLLLNVGPTHDGRIVPVFQERLLQLGAWMKVNGDAIYSTKPWRVFNDTEKEIIWYTFKGTSVFALVTEWPENGMITLHAPVPAVHSRVTMLGYQVPISWVGKFGQPGMVLDVHTMKNKLPCDWAWVFRLDNVN